VEIRALSGLVYLNNATTGHPTCAAAVEAFLAEVASVPIAARSELVDPSALASRATVGRLLGVSAEEVFFVSDATLALNVALRGLMRAGGLCIVDNRAHNAVLRTLYGSGARHHEAAIYDLDEKLCDEKMERVVASSADVVCLTYVSNVTGSIYSIGPWIDRLQEAGKAVVVDASQAAGTAQLTDVANADAVVFPGHKFLHSVPGVAVLSLRRAVPSLIFGGTGDRSASGETARPGSRFTEVGTGNPPALRALGAAVGEHLAAAVEHRAVIASRLERLWHGLSAVPGLRLLGRPPGAERTGVLACVPAIGDSELEWVPLLRRAGVVVRGGFHCSPSIHRQVGSASIRFAVSRFTTERDIDLALGAVGHVAALLESAG